MTYECWSTTISGDDFVWIADVEIKDRPKSLLVTPLTPRRGGYDDLEGFCPSCLERMYSKGGMVVKKEAKKGFRTYDYFEIRDDEILVYPGRWGVPVVFKKKRDKE